MTVQALPDAIGAIIGRLGSFVEITDFVTTASGYTADATTSQKARPRISPDFQSSWQLGRFPATPTDTKGSYALLVSGPIGNPLDDREAGIQSVRVDLHWYGPTPYDAMRFWRQGDPCLCPPAHQGIAESFIRSGVRFLTVDREGGPNRMVEPDTRFPKVVATYVFRFSEVSA